MKHVKLIRLKNTNVFALVPVGVRQFLKFQNQKKNYDLVRLRNVKNQMANQLNQH